MRPVVLGVLVLQLAVPTAMLVDRWVDEGATPTTERPASWQMYSSVERPAYSGTDRGGRTRTLDAGALPWGAVATGRVVPDRLCDRHPDLRAVTRTGGAYPGVFPC